MIQQKIVAFLDAHTRQLFDVDNGKLKAFPRPVIWLVYIMSLSVLVQGVFDVGIKLAGYTPWFAHFPWRVDFLFLTGISVLMGYQALIGMRRRELDVTRNSVQIGLLVEFGLFFGDIIYVIQHGATMPGITSVRMPFIVLTFINILILFYLVHCLDLFTDSDGKWRLF